MSSVFIRASRGCAQSSTRGGSPSFNEPVMRTRAGRISKEPTSGRPRTPQSTQGPGWLGRYLDSIPAPVDPLAAWNTAGETPRALHARFGLGAVDPESGGICVSEPERQRRSGSRACVRRAHVVASSDSPPASRVRQCERAGGVRDARSRVHSWPVRADRDLSEQWIRAGTASGCRRAFNPHRNARVLGADRRIRYARRPEHVERNVRRAHDHAERRASCVLSGCEQPGPS